HRPLRSRGIRPLHRRAHAGLPGPRDAGMSCRYRSLPLTTDRASASRLDCCIMSEIVNLREARKRKARAEKEAEAAANRRKFGRTKAERKQSEADRAKAARDLDGKKRD